MKMTLSGISLGRCAALALVSGALLLLAGCAQIEPRDSATGATQDAKVQPPTSEIAALLHYAQSVKAQTGRDLAEEQERVRLAWVAEKSDVYALQYVFALTTPGASATHQKRALQVLDGLLLPAEGRGAEVQALAVLVRGDLAERRRLEDIAYIQTQKLREEQRRAEELDKKVETLSKKLEALIAIERNLLKRDKTTGIRK